MTKEPDFFITKYPAPILRQKAKFVTDITSEIRDIVKKMASTMRSHKGVGLAAQQVGLDIQVAVVDAGDGLLKMINPIILKREGSEMMDEGCLSIPETVVTVKRAKKVTIQYTNDKKEKIIKIFDGMTARAIQHELDHLDGQMIIDYLPWYKKIVNQGK